MHCEIFKKISTKNEIDVLGFSQLWTDISVLVLKCDVSGTSDIHFSLVFSLVSCFNVINGLVLEVRGEDVIVF